MHMWLHVKLDQKWKVVSFFRILVWISVRPKPGFGIGNRNQDQVSVSVSVPELFLPKPKLSSIFIPWYYFSKNALLFGLEQSSCLAVFTKDWFQSFLIKGSKIFHWTANHFSVFCFPWAKVWKNINILVIYHTNLFYVKFLQKCHQLSNFWFELFFYNSGHLQQLHFFLLWAGINPIF